MNRPAPVPVAVDDPDCGAAGSDDPITGKPQCKLARSVALVSAQSSSDTLYDSKVNAYESFENPVPIDRLVFLSYILLFLILTCIAIVFLSSISGIRKNTILVFAFLLILLLALLQKRDVD